MEGVVDFGGVVGWTNSVKPVVDIMWRDEWWKKQGRVFARVEESLKRGRGCILLVLSLILLSSSFPCLCSLIFYFETL